MKNLLPLGGAELDWHLRGWLACMGGALCALMFIFLGQAHFQQAKADAAEAARLAELDQMAQDFAMWSESRNADRVITAADIVPERAQVGTEDLLKLASNASSYVSDIVSFDFSLIESADISADEQKCLTQAIYYEAGYEPVMGRMAVADVILNRVASSRYPNSICGVVYQGSKRKTGCQFSFTCDGSLNRVPHGATFEKAENMASAILAGIHLPVSNNATHYHAYYVSPKWAPKLTKTATIGAHRFYRVPTVTTSGTRTMVAAAQ